MAVQDLRGGSGGIPAQGSHGRFFVCENIIDFATALSAGYLLSTDTAKVMDIEAGWVVLQAFIKVIRKGTIGATTATLGDSIASDSFMDTANAIGTGATNGTVFQMLKDDNNGPDNMLGYYYTADDYLLLTPSAANFDGKLHFSMLFVKPFEIS